MARKKINYYLIKTARVTGWLLFLLVLLYIMTGFVLCRRYGFNRLMSYEAAIVLHKIFEWPLIVVFLVHSSTTIYFAFRRWGWIGKRTKA